MQIEHIVNVKVSEDTQGKEILFGPNEEQARVTIGVYDKVTSGTFSLADAETWSIPLGDVGQPRGIYLRVDQEVDVDINGLGAIGLKKPVSTSVPRLFLEAVLTSVQLTNNAGAPAVGMFCVWGLES